VARNLLSISYYITEDVPFPVRGKTLRFAEALWNYRSGRIVKSFATISSRRL